MLAGPAAAAARRPGAPGARARGREGAPSPPQLPYNIVFAGFTSGDSFSSINAELFRSSHPSLVYFMIYHSLSSAGRPPPLSLPIFHKLEIDRAYSD